MAKQAPGAAFREINESLARQRAAAQRGEKQKPGELLGDEFECDLARHAMPVGAAVLQTKRIRARQRHLVKVARARERARLEELREKASECIDEAKVLERQARRRVSPGRMAAAVKGGIRRAEKRSEAADRVRNDLSAPHMNRNLAIVWEKLQNRPDWYGRSHMTPTEAFLEFAKDNSADLEAMANDIEETRLQEELAARYEEERLEAEELGDVPF